MKRLRLVLLFGFPLLGCGSPSPGPGVAAAGPLDSGSPPVDAAAVDAGNDTGPSGPPGVPVLTSATLVTHGTMMISWTLPASGCDTIAVNRNSNGAGYAVAQMVTGVATSATDMPGHATGMYCYTVSCALGGMTSAPSNERCVTQ